MTDPVGRHYGSVVRPDPADYDRCPYAGVTKGDDPLVGIFVGWYDTGDYGIRPCYDAVIRWNNGFAYGSDYNPHTVDHRNHPGMFNEKGHVGFLGHGAGIKFRNVRILDLSE